jgi:hypothetical protein
MVSGTILVRVQRYIIFVRIYVEHNGYWISSTIQIQVLDEIRVWVGGPKWSIRAT